MTYTIQELTPTLLQSQTENYFATLKNLTTIQEMSPDLAVETLKQINNQGTHIYIAMHDDGKIVGTISLLLEQKFLRNGAVAGHLEDVAVRDGYEGQGI